MDGKIDLLMEQVERRGMRIASDSGFLTITPSEDQLPDDDGETQQMLIKPLGKWLKEVSSVAMARSRGVRGKDFIGRTVFVPSQKLWGKLEDVNSSGIVTLSYTNPYDEPRVPTLSYTGPGDDLLIIVADEAAKVASPSSFSGIAEEKKLRLFEFAESIGLTFEHDSGFTLVKWRAISGVEWKTCEQTIRQLSIQDLFSYTVGQARGRRGAAFVGQVVFVPEFDSFGVLASADFNGMVSVTYRDRHMDLERTCFVHGDGLLIMSEKIEDAAQFSSANQNRVPAWRRLVSPEFRG